MKVFGITMVKDEEDILEYTLHHMAFQGVDGIIVADNNSVDNTPQILETIDLPCQLIVLQDSDPAYYQSRKMSALAEKAYLDYGAEWIIPFDADELWSSAGWKLADFLRQVRDLYIIEAELYNYWPSSLDIEGISNPYESIVWREPAPAPLPKVCFRPVKDGFTIQQGNHNVEYTLTEAKWGKGIRISHFPSRTFEQFSKKVQNGAAAYRAAKDLPYEMGEHWRSYGELLDRAGEEALFEHWKKWFYYCDPTLSLMRDPAPYMKTP